MGSLNLIPEKLKGTVIEKIIQSFQDFIEDRISYDELLNKLRYSIDINIDENLPKAREIFDPLNTVNTFLKDYPVERIRTFLKQLPMFYDIKGTRSAFYYIMSLLGIDAEIYFWYEPEYQHYISGVIPCTAIVKINNSVIFSQDVLDKFELIADLFLDLCLSFNYILSREWQEFINFAEVFYYQDKLELCDRTYYQLRWLTVSQVNPQYGIYSRAFIIPGAVPFINLCKEDPPVNLCERPLAICPQLPCLPPYETFSYFDGNTIFSGERLVNSVGIYYLDTDYEIYGDVFRLFLDDFIPVSEWFYIEISLSLEDNIPFHDEILIVDKLFSRDSIYFKYDGIYNFAGNLNFVRYKIEDIRFTEKLFLNDDFSYCFRFDGLSIFNHIRAYRGSYECPLSDVLSFTIDYPLEDTIIYNDSILPQRRDYFYDRNLLTFDGFVRWNSLVSYKDEEDRLKSSVAIHLTDINPISVRFNLDNYLSLEDSLQTSDSFKIEQSLPLSDSIFINSTYSDYYNLFLEDTILCSTNFNKNVSFNFSDTVNVNSDFLIQNKPDLVDIYEYVLPVFNSDILYNGSIGYVAQDSESPEVFYWTGDAIQSLFDGGDWFMGYIKYVENSTDIYPYQIELP